MRRNRRRLPRRWAFVRHVPYAGSEPMMGGVDRRGVTIHDEGVAHPCHGTHTGLAEYVNSRGISYHLLWCPRCGQWVQMIPLHHAARSLKGGAILPNGASVNKAGQRNIQICLVGYANGVDERGEPVSASPMRNAWVLAEIMDAHDIPWRVRRRWGAGASRSLRAWLHSGVHGHQHSPAPGETHTDPGSLDITAVLAEARRQRASRALRTARGTAAS